MGRVPVRTSSPPRTILHIKGLVSAKDRILRDMEIFVARSRTNGGPLFEWNDSEVLRARAEDLSRHVLEICSRRDMEPADMASPSRRAFQLLSFIASEHQLQRHLETLRGLSRAGGEDGRVVSRLDHIGALYRIERRGERIRLVASEGFVGAPEPVLRALVQVATPYARKQRPRREIRDYVDGPRYADALRLVEKAGGAYRSRPRGRIHDLRVLFDRVNADYFGGEQTPPRLLWSERVPSVEFGHYEPATDTVRLSQRLDAPDVPRFVLEHVMHHELLHRALGAERRGDRRRYHSGRFRREERRFERYAEAEAFLEKVARAG
jgi:hypothetical protein